MAIKHIDQTAGTYYSCGICLKDFDAAKEALSCERICQIERYLHWAFPDSPPSDERPKLFDERGNVILTERREIDV